ncbi:MAG: hypothetical protein K0S61_222 [Anaerocolumna sp.]|jgi:hypothetical protein|nr:hypothetical protein [Anaerocolumna sp.]
MEKAKIISIIYEPSDTIEKQGKRKDIERYLKDGYYIKEERNGYWVLVKTARLIVTLANDSHTRVFNMKEDICDYYGKNRISQSLVDRFSKDIGNGTISIFLDSKGNYEIK